MALPSSGTISMDMIRIELGVPTQSPFGLNEARNGTYVALNPNSPTLPPSSGQVSLSDWYSYDQSAGGTCECWTIVNEGGGTGNYSYDRCSDGTTLTRNIATGVTQTVCASGGTTPFQNTGTLTIYECNTPCSTNPDCASC